MKAIQLLVAIIFLFSGTVSFAQRNGKGGQGSQNQGRGNQPQGGNKQPQGRGTQHQQPRNQDRRNKQVVRRSPHRPHKVVAYHPHWHPHYTYHRRWVYFPHYNLYWDNWRNQYVFWNGAIWISQPQVPPVIINVDLEKEKKAELNEDEDDVDDIYKSNDNHKTRIKPE